MTKQAKFKADMAIKVRDRTVYTIGKKHYFSLFGACRQRALIKIMSRLGDHFKEMGPAEREYANTKDYPPQATFETWAQYEARMYPVKHRFKRMRERLARTIYRRQKEDLCL